MGDIHSSAINSKKDSSVILDNGIVLNIEEQHSALLRYVERNLAIPYYYHLIKQMPVSEIEVELKEPITSIQQKLKRINVKYELGVSKADYAGGIHLTIYRGSVADGNWMTIGTFSVVPHHSDIWEYCNGIEDSIRTGQRVLLDGDIVFDIADERRAISAWIVKKTMI